MFPGAVRCDRGWDLRCIRVVERSELSARGILPGGESPLPGPSPRAREGAQRLLGCALDQNRAYDFT
jgi:hypothetical protein